MFFVFISCYRFMKYLVEETFTPSRLEYEIPLTISEGGGGTYYGTVYIIGPTTQTNTWN